MVFLLDLKEKFKKLYRDYNFALVHLARFVVAFVSMMLINSYVGYMSKLNNILAVLAVAVIATVLPNGATIVILSLVLVLHLYALIPELAIVALAVFLVMYLLYFRFTPKSSYLLIITAALCALKVPYIIPVAAALLSGLASIIPTCFGVIVYYIIQNGAEYEVAMSNQGNQVISFTMGSLVNNRAMLITLVAFIVTIILVYVVKRLSVDHAWVYAIFSGVVVQFLVMIIGKLILKADIDIVFLIVGTLLAAGLSFILQVMFFNLDYKRTEYVQYEDDEYYYYVKAVPKVVIASSNRQVTTINERKAKRTDKLSSKTVAPVKRSIQDDDISIEFVNDDEE
ncbi:MAG: hypothetical protein ACI4EV_09230 [Lachnospiraceae bacterium]